MSSQFIIQSNENYLALELCAKDADSIVAKLSGAGINTEALVYTYLSKGIAKFFANLASNWKGWEGNIEWGSLEGEFKLKATCDLLGHIFLSVYLANGAPPIWEVNAELMLEAGQLDRLAFEARAFESVAFGPA